MSSKKVSFEDSLAKSVVATGKCVGCGTCVVVCPFNCLEYGEEKPFLIKECKACGICARTCPRYEWSQSKAETFAFGRERKSEEEFGVYRRIVIAQAKDDEVLKVCQDGGVATALLLFALENGLIDGAVVAEKTREKPFYPAPKLTTTPQEILECAGTKYFYSPNILAMTEAVKQKKTSIAFLGTPCQIHAIRKMQMAGLTKWTTPVKFLIGLMCSECFMYEGLMERYIHEKLGVNLNSIKKMDIKGKMLVKMETEVKAIPIVEIKQYARKSCSFCGDFSSELADVSIGGLGLDGWTFVVIRTKEGEEIFEKAEKALALKTKPAAKEKAAFDLLVKLSSRKRKSTQLS